MDAPTIINSKIAALKEELRLAERLEHAAKLAAIDAFTPQYLFTLLPADRTFDRLWDPTIKTYYLRGIMLNGAELKALGGSPFEGGMAYYYNTSTHLLMGPVGGGSLFIGSSGWSSSELSPEDATKIAALSHFLHIHPDGGDVTDIIDYHPRRRALR